MSLDDFDLIEINDDTDLDELKETIGRIFFKDDEGFIYSYDLTYDINLKYDPKHDEWIEVDEKDVPSITSDYDFDEAVERFKDNLPWKKFKEVIAQLGQKRKEYYEKELLNPKLKVVGWLDSEIISENEIELDESEDGFIALVKDIKDHHYLFAGMSYNYSFSLYAILNNGKYIDLSSRTFGEAFAIARGHYEFLDYARYAFELPEDEEKEELFPKEGLYEFDNVTSSINVRSSFMDLMYDISNLYIHNGLMGSVSAIYPYKVKDSDLFLPTKNLTLIDENDQERTREVTFKQLNDYKDIKELDEYIEKIKYYSDGIIIEHFSSGNKGKIFINSSDLKNKPVEGSVELNMTLKELENSEVFKESLPDIDSILIYDKEEIEKYISQEDIQLLIIKVY